MFFHDSPWRLWLAVPYVSCILNKVSKHWVNFRFKISPPSVIQTFNFLNPVVIYWDMATVTSVVKEVEMIFGSYYSFLYICFFFSIEMNFSSANLCCCFLCCYLWCGYEPISLLPCHSFLTQFISTVMTLDLGPSAISSLIGLSLNGMRFR